MDKKSECVNKPTTLKRSLSLTIATLAATGGGLALPNFAHAQLEEVVVTARARSESLQDVPATVTAFTESQIRDSGIQRAEDFIYMTPGVTFVNTVEVGDSQLSIRGINGARDGETNFAFIVDGILYTNPSAFNREYPDLAQIEVLKGPQGALYGRSAAAGAVIMSTKRPSDEFEALLRGSYGEYNTATGMFSVAGPLGDSVAGRLTVDYRSTDGFLENTNPAQSDKDIVNDAENYGVSGRLVFDPTDDLSIDTKIRYAEAEGASIAFNAAFEIPLFAGLFGGFGPEGSIATVPGYESFYQDVNEHDFVFSPNTRPYNEQETLELSIKADYQMDMGTLTAWALYSDQEQYFVADGTSGAFGFYGADPACVSSLQSNVGFTPDASREGYPGFPPPVPLQAPAFNFGSGQLGVDNVLPPYSPTTCDGYQYQERNQEDISFQVQLTSNDDQALRWQVGAYFLDIDRTVGVAQLRDDGTQNFPLSFVNQYTDALVLDNFETSVWAVFGSVNYDISERIELSLALRYDREERDVNNEVPSPADGFLSTNIDYCAGRCTLNGQPLNGTPWNPAFITSFDTWEVTDSIGSRNATFSEWQPKVSLTWDMTDNTTLFSSWGVGFKTGGFNNLGGTETVQQFLVNTGAALVAPPEIYDKETSSAFEVGFRSALFDNRLNLNGAAFYTEVDDMQFFEFFVGPFGLLRTVENIDEVTLQGFELSAAWAITDNLRLDAGYGSVDGEIDANSIRPYTAGNDVPNNAEFTANVGLQWTQPIGNLELLARIEYAHQGDTWYHVVQDDIVPAVLFGPFSPCTDGTALDGVCGNFDQTQVDGYGITNVRLGIGGDNWRITAYSRNVFDEEYIAEVIMAPEFGGAFVHPGQVRMSGVEIEVNF